MINKGEKNLLSRSSQLSEGIQRSKQITTERGRVRAMREMKQPALEARREQLIF